MNHPKCDLPPHEISAPRSIIFGHGVHSDEPQVQELYAHLTQTRDPIENVDHHIVSKEDWELKRRLIGGVENMGIIDPDTQGTHAQRLLARYCLRAQTYDLAIHPHGTTLPGGEVAIYGVNASPLVKRVAAYMGLGRAIIREDGPEAALSNALSFEMVADSHILNPSAIYAKVVSLLDEPTLPNQNLEEYAYVGDVTAKSAADLNLQRQYEPLSPLTNHDARAIHGAIGAYGVTLVAHAWDAGANDESKGYRGEIFARLPLPKHLSTLSKDRFVV